MGKEPEKRSRFRRRQKHVRRDVVGTPERPRLAVFRSNLHIYAQVIDDTAGRTLAAASTQGADFRTEKRAGGNVKAAEVIGGMIAKAAISKGVSKVVFDRRGYKYHGRVQALAEAARKGGLQF